MQAQAVALTPVEILELLAELQEMIERAQNATAGALELCERIERTARFNMEGGTSYLFQYVGAEAEVCRGDLAGEGYSGGPQFERALDAVALMRDVAELAARRSG